jgi:L,D-transpeptidase YcbB
LLQHIPPFFSRLFITLVAIAVIAACREKPEPPLARRSKNRRGELVLHLDSAALMKRIREYGLSPELRESIRDFYSERDYRGAWVTRRGVNEFAGHFLNLLSNEYQTVQDDSIIYKEHLYELYRDFFTPSRSDHNLKDAAELELLLSANFFSFANRTWGGVHDTVLRRVHWFIARKKMDYPALLDEFLSNGKSVVPRIPVYEQYNLLREWLRRYAQLDDEGTIPVIADSLILKRGDSAATVRDIRKLLYYLNDLGEDNGSAKFDSSFAAGIKSFQQRHGLDDAGVLGRQTSKWLRISLRERIEKILVNMERCRWVPLALKGNYLFVNIPEFKLYVFDDSRVAWSCKTIVGKSDPVFKTIVFNDSMEFVVFNPYWNVPRNIFYKETLPELQKDAAYLIRNNFEVVDRKGNAVNTATLQWKTYVDNFPYIVREKPGPKNSLGVVKFLFPNAYDIYFHDTPAKALFESSSRAFSHGCIRLEQPMRLARHLLAPDSLMTGEAIDKIIASEQETFVRLKKKVPVFIAYFTAWVDRDGKLNFRGDIYGHDAEMSEVLFED